MSISRAFLRPRSVMEPPQGDFEYVPVIRGYEDTTLAGLNAKLQTEKDIQAASVDELFVIEEIEYQVVVTKPSIGGNPAELLYSAMVWATEVVKV